MKIGHWVFILLKMDQYLSSNTIKNGMNISLNLLIHLIELIKKVKNNILKIDKLLDLLKIVIIIVKLDKI